MYRHCFYQELLYSWKLLKLYESVCLARVMNLNYNEDSPAKCGRRRKTIFSNYLIVWYKKWISLCSGNQNSNLQASVCIQQVAKIDKYSLEVCSMC